MYNALDLANKLRNDYEKTWCNTKSYLVIIISFTHESVKSRCSDTATLSELHRQVELNIRLVFVILGDCSLLQLFSYTLRISDCRFVNLHLFVRQSVRLSVSLSVSK